jgi:Uma2 family endonuclease
MATKALLTSEDFEQIVSRLPEDRRWELIKGELYAMGGATDRHGAIAAQVARLLLNWNDSARAGTVHVETGYTIEQQPDTVRVPDIAFVRKGRVPPEQRRRGYPRLAPDFVAEIRSPNDRWQYLVDKAENLFQAGTRMALLFEADEFAELRRPGQEPRKLLPDDIFDGEDILPGFRCRVRDFFPPEED